VIILEKTKIVVYPAVFIHDKETDTLTIVFPDVPSAISQAKTFGEAMLNANEVLGLMLYDAERLPVATPIEQVRAAYPQDEVQAIAVDLVKAAKGVIKPLVRKNTTIPADLAQAASQKGLNFSTILTDALRVKLNELATSKEA